MTDADHDETDRHEEDEGPGPPEGEETATKGRTTAPQSPYTMGDVGVGAAIALVGVLVAFGIPLLFL